MFSHRNAGRCASLLSISVVFVVVSGRGGDARAEEVAAPNPAGGGASLVLEPVTVTAKPRRNRLVYACRGQSTVVFSDRPCDVEMTSRSVSYTPAITAGAAPSTAARTPTASTRPRPQQTDRYTAAAARSAGNATDRCSSLRAQLETVDARMRHGYSAREAARLWNRWRELKERLHDARC